MQKKRLFCYKIYDIENGFFCIADSLTFLQGLVSQPKYDFKLNSQSPAKEPPMFDLRENVRRIYFHGSCTDGITAREILKTGLQSKPYIPYYFTEFPTVPERALFVDCCPKMEQIEAVLKAGGAIVDHHAHNLEKLSELKSIYPDQIMIGRNEASESGAVLAAYIAEEQFELPVAILEKIYDVANLVAIGDTWQKENPSFSVARELGGFVSFFGNDFSFDFETDLDWGLIERFGKARARTQRGLAMTAVCYHSHAFGNIFFINQLDMSDAAEILRNEKNADIVVGWEMKKSYGNENPSIIYSLRSKENGFDCAAHCLANGGGGHKAAAGFSIEIENSIFDEVQPIRMFLDAL